MSQYCSAAICSSFFPFLPGAQFVKTYLRSPKLRTSFEYGWKPKLCGLVTEARFGPYPEGKQVVNAASPALTGILRVGSLLSCKCRGRNLSNAQRLGTGGRFSTSSDLCASHMVLCLVLRRPEAATVSLDCIS